MSKHRNRAIVPILNPRDDRKYTSEKRALHYIERGDAEFVQAADGRRFLHFTVPQRHLAPLFDPFTANGMATLENIAGLPVVGDVVKLVIKPSPPVARRAPRQRSGKVIVVLSVAA